MKNFRDLQKNHELLLKSKQAGEDIVKEVESYIEVTINAGQDITNSFQREQLRANNRYWGNYIYEKTSIFPKTDIDPPSENALLRQRIFTWAIRGLTLLMFSIITIVLYQSLFVSPPATALPQIVCTPNPSNVNVYRVPPQSWANTIFEYAFPIIPTPNPPNPPIPTQFNEQQILGARYAAFLQLTNETERWSHIETIKLDDSSEAQIILTFISPELLQAVFLNDVLRDHFLTSGFQTQIQKVLNAVAARDELLFLLTVTATNNNNPNLPHHIIKIPIGNMILNNAENFRVEPSHDDKNLDQPINSSIKPVFGYLAYPLASLSGSQCKWILDPKYNTNIVITVTSIEVDGVSKGPYSWTIPYVPLISPIMPPDPPVFIMPSGFDQNLMSPLPLPPIGMNQTNNWQDFARFVWNQITLGNY